MKKMIGVLAVVCALTACGTFNSATKEDSTKVKLRSCMVQEATAKLKAGTLTTKNAKKTAKNISTSCVKKLALQSAGLDTKETETLATTVINEVMNSKK
ncbi:MAG: hypothetical protein J5787_00810 [Alphaproteobacteria bacterium]|nr:hypothetical protein [Alphaproteobacteria bacterium]MBO4643097.1 hypothetical protein [Alphaproteobacteria bacterium]